MPVFEIVLEIQDGMSSYEHREFALAFDPAMASRFAQELARHWRPNATYDPQADVYSAPEGYPQWTIAHCAPVTHLRVPVVGRRKPAQVALVPWEDFFGNGLRVAVDFLHALTEPTLSDCSLKQIVGDHLQMSEADLQDAIKTIIALCQRVPEYPDSVPQAALKVAV